MPMQACDERGEIGTDHMLAEPDFEPPAFGTQGAQCTIVRLQQLSRSFEKRAAGRRQAHDARGALK